MARVEGTHAQGASGRAVRYRVDYEVVGHTIHFRASFDGGSTRTKASSTSIRRSLDAAAAVDAFMQNHIEKADWDVAP